jgi:hypothetical protein
MRWLWLFVFLWLAACEPATPVEVVPTLTSATSMLQAVATPTTAVCPPSDYVPTTAVHVVWQDDQFWQDGEVFPIHGVVLNTNIMTGEFGQLVEALRLMSEAGFNTLTIELDKTTSGEVLDRLFAVAAQFSLYVIVSANETSALTDLASRYAQEPTLLAWEFSREDSNLENALLALAEQRRAVRVCDARPLIAAWESDLLAAAPFVDIVGIVHWTDYESLRQTFANVTAQTSKPTLLARIGYDASMVEETGQRTLVFQALEEAANYKALGWVVYSAFDNGTRTTGIWDNESQPRLVLGAIQRIISRETLFPRS